MSSFLLINEYQILGIAVVVLLFAALSVLVAVRRDYERAATAPYNMRSIGPDESGLTNLCMLYDEKHLVLSKTLNVRACCVLRFR
jgi:hypothetical protein